MKHKLWPHHLLGALFAFALSVSTVGCLLTGFDLNVESAGRLFAGCFGISAVSCILFRFRFGGCMLFFLSAIPWAVFWKQSYFWSQWQTLLLTISDQYHRTYGWPLIGTNAASTMDLPLLVLGGWTAVSVSYCFWRRRTLAAAVPPVALPVVASMIVTTTVPDGFYLYLLILCVALLLLTDWVRRNHPTQSISLTLRMAIPLAAAIGLLFALNPQDSYVNRAAQLQKEMTVWFQKLQDSPQQGLSGVDTIGFERLSLRSVGPKSNLSYAVMRISSPVDGTVYLRGRDYDVYTGTGWEATQKRAEVFSRGSNSKGTLTITTYGTRNIIYIPYYACDAVTLTGGAAENSDNLTRYSYELSGYPAYEYAFPDPRYVLLPENTMDWASALVGQIADSYADQETKVQAIGDYIRSAADYDLSTARMSAEYSDFAQWFLNESDTGYCVHFATSATVLLRAAGIPARYVEGYMVGGYSGEDTVVSSTDAHAWCEYYDSDAGAWMILEATPADESEETEPPVSLATEPELTEGPETEPESSEPSEPKSSVPANGTNAPALPKEPFRLPGWVKTVAGILSVLALMILQGELRILWKRRNWNRGNSNERAIARWNQVRQLAKHLNIPLPEELDALAQKAKFSQHTLTREELLQFDAFRKECMTQLCKMSLPRRWYLRWTFAIG